MEISPSKDIECVKLVDNIWPNSPLVTVIDRHGRDGEQTDYRWDNLEVCTYPRILIIGEMLKFDVRLECNSTGRDATFRIRVQRLDRHEDVTEVIHDADNYYVDSGENRTVTISAPLTDANWIHLKVTIWNLQDRSTSGTETWYGPESKKYQAMGIGDPSKWPTCFIATAAYGSEMASPVQFLREFRDNTVLKSRYSRFFKKTLDIYYAFSPPIAKTMMEHKALKFVIKYVIVWPFVKIAQACAIIINFLSKSEP